MNRYIVLKSIENAISSGGTELILNLRPKEGMPTAIAKQAELMLLDIDLIESEEMIDQITVSLPNLERLVITGGQMQTLHPKICRLDKLWSLTISSSNLTDIGDLFQLTRLRYLDLSENVLRELPAGIDKLTSLQHLDLSNNRLTEIPPSLVKLTGLRFLDLQGNGLALSPEILRLADRPEGILNAIFLLSTEGKRYLNEAKMILVGEGAVGKTSVVNCLFNQPFNPNERKTEGLEIRNWTIKAGYEDVKLHLWDFGGQEIYHATHQFFLTKRSLYVLVIDARQDEYRNRIEYWLRLIRSLGADSPIIMVVNKWEQHKLDIDRRRLNEKYDIAAFVETSCVSGKGIADLRQAIGTVVSKLKHVHDLLPETWFQVKRRLEDMERDFITYDEYEKVCEQENVREELSRRTLIGYLHDLGVVLNFQEDDRLRDTNVLNPKWVTEGVYQLLTSYEIAQNKGALSLSELDKILNPTRFPRNRHRFIIEMMEKFELCFEFPDKPEHYLIPSHLQKEEPELNWSFNDCLAFQYHYETLPASIISRLIVRMNEFISRKTYWRTGVVLKLEANKALVKADLEDRNVFIYVIGKEETRRAFLTVIRSHFDTIHKSIAKIEAVEKVPVPGALEIVCDYQHLVNLENAGITEWIPEGMTKALKVKLVLNGIQAEDERLQWNRERAEEAAISARLKLRSMQESKQSWISGSFYVVSFLILLGAIVGAAILISNYVLWQTGLILSLILFATLLTVSIVGALQLRQDGKFSDDNFLKLMIEAFKRLRFLRD